jgi:hypothetical protein
LNSQLAFVLSLFAAAVIGFTFRWLSSGVTDATTSSWVGLISGGIVAAVGLVNSVLTGIKTVQEIRLNKRKIFEQDRRIHEPPPMRLELGPKINLGIKPFITGEESEERERRS